MKAKGFTIVELLVVVVVIGVLATIVGVSYVNITSRADEAAVRSNLSSFANKIKTFQAEYNIAPNSITDCPNPAAGNLCLDSGGNISYEYIPNNLSGSSSFCLSGKKAGAEYFVAGNLPVSSGDCSLFNGLAAYYPLDSDANDHSGNNNDGIVHGAAPSTNSVVGGSYLFDGNDYIDLGTNSSLKSQSITISAWVNARTFPNSWSGIISNMPEWGTGFSLQIGPTEKIAAMVSGSYLTTSWSPTTGTWYHVVGVHDGATNTTNLYVNGTLENSYSYTISYVQNNPTYLGVFYTKGPSLFLDGYLDEVRIYARALSASEVTALYNYR